MADPVSTASTKLPHHRRRETRAASDLEPGERANLALDDAESAARLLEGAFVSTIEENELFMPAVERLFAALQEAEASVTLLEARLPRGHWRGGP